MLEAFYDSKKDLKKAIGQKFYFAETSMFGPEYKGDGTYYCVGPSAENRKWFAQVTIREGKIVKVT